MGGVAVAAFGANDDWEIVAVADREAHRREAACSGLPNVVVEEDATTLCERSFLLRHNIELLVVATPPYTHAELCTAALANGVHVLCEKPLARDVDEAERMCFAATASDHLAVVDFQLRFNGARRWLRDQIAQVALGMIRMVEVRYALPTMFDAPWSWLSDAESGGGLLNEFGSHVVDLLRWYFGEIVAVQGCAVRIKELRQDGASRRKADADDIALMTLGWQSGLVATIALSSVFRPAARDLTLHGDTLTMRLDQDDRVAEYVPSGQLLQSRDLSEREPSLINRVNDTFSQPFLRLVTQLGNSIRHGTRPADIATFDDGLRVVEVLDNVRRTSRSLPTGP